MTEHTPGPWKTNGSVVSARVGPSQRQICDLSTSAPSCGEIYDIERHRTALMANAALIAAAPELLEEMQEAAAQAHCGCEHPACNQCARDKRWKEVINMATGV